MFDKSKYIQPGKYWYDAEAANKVITFIESYCTHVKGKLAGQPLKLAPFWKDDIIRPAFGIKKVSDNKRRFKTIYLEIGKGNAKSTVGAGIALYLLGADGQMNPEIYSLAGDREQARIIFDTARAMIDQNPTLQKYYRTYQYSIVKNGSHGSYKVVSSESKTKHGFIPYGIIVDEVHVQPNRDLWDTTTAGQMKIDESITFAFTTAGHNKQSICYELHDKAVKINKGLITDNSFLGIIYSAGMDDPIHKVSTWRKANPGLGNIITVENLKIEYNKVVTSPNYENTFRRLHLNQWTDTYESWISDIEWMKCNSKLNVDLTEVPCWGGLDLGSTRDFNALVYIYPIMKEGEKFIIKEFIKDKEGIDQEVIKVNYNAIEQIPVKMWTWCPSEMIDSRVKRFTNDFQMWVKDGYIIELPGVISDHNIVANDIQDTLNENNVQSIAYDQKSAAPIVLQLGSYVDMEPFDQSITSISFPTKELNSFIGRGLLNHFNNPVLRWMMSNVVIYTDPNENIKVVKHKSTDKVDGVISLIMAIGQWLDYEMKGGSAGSVYETRGVLTL